MGPPLEEGFFQLGVATWIPSGGAGAGVWAGLGVGVRGVDQADVGQEDGGLRGDKVTQAADVRLDV